VIETRWNKQKKTEKKNNRCIAFLRKFFEKYAHFLVWNLKFERMEVDEGSSAASKQVSSKFSEVSAFFSVDKARFVRQFFFVLLLFVDHGSFWNSRQRYDLLASVGYHEHLWALDPDEGADGKAPESFWGPDWKAERPQHRGHELLRVGLHCPGFSVINPFFFVIEN
jgi:hypothetical protein